MKPITQEEKNGREFVFNLLPALRKMSEAEIEKEKAFYLDVLILETKTRVQIDQESVRSENALLVIQRKELERGAELRQIIKSGEKEFDELYSKYLGKWTKMS